MDDKNQGATQVAEPVSVTAQVSGSEPTTGSIVVTGSTKADSYEVPAVVFSEEQARLILAWSGSDY